MHGAANANKTPSQRHARPNDGKTIYRLSLKDVPVDGFWSISVYSDKGHFVANPQNAYSLNNLIAKPADDDVPISSSAAATARRQLSPIFPPGWNYLVRLYRPKPEILNGASNIPSRKRRIETLA